MNTKRLTSALLLFSMCGLSFAQKPLTLDKCRETALKNSKTAAIAALNKDKAAYTQAAYRANYFPKISASGYYLHSDLVPNLSLNLDKISLPALPGPDGTPLFKDPLPLPNLDFSLKLKNLWTAALIAEQPLFAGGKITAAYRMARTGSEIAALNQQLSRAEIIVQTDEAYWTCIQTDELLQLALSYRKTLAELLRNVQAAEAAGMKHRNDVMKVQVKMNEAELQLRRAENATRLARKNLCRIMGIPTDGDLSFPDSFAPPTPFAPPIADPDNRPEYRLLEKQVTLKQHEISLVRSDFLPQIGLTAAYGHTSGGTLNGNKLFDRASFSLLASLRIPLFHWGEGRNKIRAAQAERTAAQFQRDDLAQQMALDLSRAIDKCNESSLELELTARSLRQAEENQTLSRLHYEAGMETLSACLEAETQRQQAYSEYINAQTRARLNQTYYLRAAGRLVDEANEGR